MASNPRMVPVQGSERAPVAGAHAVGPVDPNEQVEVTLVLRPNPGGDTMVAAQAMNARPPKERQYLSRDELEAARGASADDIDKIHEFAQENDLVVGEVSPARRTVTLSGTAAAMSKAFGVDLKQYQYPGGSYRGREGPVQVPADLAPIVQAVLGLDDREQAQPHFRIASAQPTVDDFQVTAAGAAQPGAQAAPGAAGAAPHATNTEFTPPQLAQLYNFPTGLDGSGQCIAIIELGGGYRTSDIKTYFKSLGIPTPRVSAISVDHGRNQPSGSPNSADGEVLLDIEVAGAVAPKANIAVYFAPNTTRGFLDAVTTAIHDKVRKPSVISISWGGPESSWTPSAMQAYDQAFQDAAALGVTICCASGDNGSDDMPSNQSDHKAHVDFPASSPNVLGCGGTHLDAAGGSITSEVVWNDGASGGAGGGGVSDMFPLPSWQSNANVPPSANSGGHQGRGVPDIAGDASPTSGYEVRVDGQNLVFGGTSAVAPLWAGLIALMNQHLQHPVGFLNPVIYALPPTCGAFHDITTGNNGAYQARTGWDPCTGLGSPDGNNLMNALQ